MKIEEIKKIKSLDDILLRILIYGESGTGKTRAAATFPDPFFFDFDQGLLSVRHEIIAGKVTGTSYDLGGWKQFRKDWDAVRQDPKHKTIIFDSLTTLAEMAMNYFQQLKGNEGEPPELRQYLLVVDRIERLLHEALPVKAHIIFTAHVQTWTEEATGILRELPLVSGKRLPDRIPLWFDEVFKAESIRQKDGSWTPTWIVKHSRKSKAKSRLGLKCEQLEPTYQAYVEALKEAFGEPRS